jgi:microcystin degradation protein MlrC
MGSVGAGTGATVGKLRARESWCKGGFGAASRTLHDGVSVTALAVVNAWGDVIDRDGTVLAGAWDAREGFLGGVTSWSEAAEIIANAARGPLVLVDIGDNPWTGGPGDSAEMLRFLLDEGITDAVLASIVDPEAVRRCLAAGVGAEVEVELGGHTDQLHGEPLPVRGYVRLLSDGRYTNAGPMHAGVEVKLGPTAVLVVDGVEVLVTSYPETPIDLNVFRAHGIEPTLKRVLALKGKGQFRAAFAPIAERIVLVEGPGITGSDLSRLSFRRVRRPIWPLDLMTIWTNA